MTTAGYYDTSYPPSLFVPVPPAPDKGSASDGESFIEPSVTAEDALNAAKLGPLGYVAAPVTAWPAGDAITVSTFDFSWSGTAWQAGAATVAAATQPAEPADNRMTVAPSAVVSNPVIAAMAPDEQLAAIAHAYAGFPAAEWSAGESASVAGRSVRWSGTEWLAADPEPAA